MDPLRLQILIASESMPELFSNLVAIKNKRTRAERLRQLAQSGMLLERLKALLLNGQLDELLRSLEQLAPSGQTSIDSSDLSHKAVGKPTNSVAPKTSRAANEAVGLSYPPGTFANQGNELPIQNESAASVLATQMYQAGNLVGL